MGETKVNVTATLRHAPSIGAEFVVSATIVYYLSFVLFMKFSLKLKESTNNNILVIIMSIFCSELKEFFNALDDRDMIML